MRENQSPSQSNESPIFIFYEQTTHFTRYDIIDRILKSLNEFHNNYIAIYIIEYPDKLESRVCGKFNCINIKTYGLDSLVKILYRPLDRCEEILVLNETGLKDLLKLCSSKCFLLGLHRTSDLGKLVSVTNKSFKIISLGKISYLTSQCVGIIGYLDKILCED